MKRTLLLIGVVAALLVEHRGLRRPRATTTQSASDNIAKSFAGVTALEVPQGGRRLLR